MPQKNELPEGWVITPFKNLLFLLESGSRPKGGVRGISEGLPSIGGEHLNDKGGFRFNKIKYVSEDFFNQMRQGKIQFNDILIVKDGATTGKVSIVKKNFPYGKAAVNEHVFLCRTFSEISSECIFYFLFSEIGQKRILNNFRGSAQGGINNSFAPNTKIPVPPLAEQHRIVAAIETLFARLDAAQAHLDRAPGIMQHFRQAVLAAACEGRLTESWRTENPQIKINDNFIEFINQSVNIQKSKKKYKISEFSKGDLPIIPNNWMWTQVFMLGVDEVVKTGPFGAILKSKEFVPEGIPIIAIGNVQKGKIDLDKARVDHVSEKKADELFKYLVKEGDVLFTRSGTIGRSLVVPKFADGWLMSYHLLRVRVNQQVILSEYLYSVFSGCQITHKCTLDAIKGTTRPGINSSILANLPVPLPPLPEQQEIVRRVDALFALADDIEERVNAARERTEKLRQSVLAQAFSGRLVPTEAELARQEGRDYEPASVLLERIEKESTEEAVKKKGKKKSGSP